MVAVTATNEVDLNQVSAFVRVMKTGSFTAAARALGLPKSSVSRRVSALEDALRVRLLQRGTRKLVLTEAGRLYFEQARPALGQLADANAAVIDMSQEVAGPIRFTAGGDNTGLIATLIAEFLGRYPKVQIEAVLTARRATGRFVAHRSPARPPRPRAVRLSQLSPPGGPAAKRGRTFRPPLRPVR